MLRLDAVEVEAGRIRLEVSLELNGPVTGVIGPSGSGKTTLLEAVAGLRPVAKGCIQFGTTLWHEHSLTLPARCRGVGYVPQDNSLFPHLNVRDNLLFGTREAAQRQGFTLEHAVDVLDLGDFLNRRVARLSGGEQRRVALGRALLSGPSLLLLDEPFAGVDVSRREKLLPYLKRVRREFQVPMLYVSHDLDEIAEIADEVVRLDEGRVVAQGKVSDLFIRRQESVWTWR